MQSNFVLKLDFYNLICIRCDSCVFGMLIRNDYFIAKSKQKSVCQKRKISNKKVSTITSQIK